MARVNNNKILDALNGHIGKQLVVKQYGYGAVVSKFPDMSQINQAKDKK